MESKITGSLPQARQQAEKLRQELRTLVVQSQPGIPLPSENALARKYNVSRMTARRALDRLEAEDLIERRNKVGSFVKGKRTITLLLPCPDFFDKKFFPHNQLYFRYFQGILQAVTERGLHLEMIAVSATNNRDNIQYSQLKDLNAGSMVICSVWFNRLYEFLLAKGAHIAIVDMQHEDYGYQQYHQYCYMINGNRNAALNQILDYFYAQGKRRIALESTVYTKPHSHYQDFYGNWCKAHNLPELRYSFPELQSTVVQFPSGMIAGLYRKDRFDALITHHFSIANAHGTIQDTLGLPPEIPVFGFEFSPDSTPDLQPFPCCFAPCETMAHTAVDMLIEAPLRGSERLLPYDFFNLPDEWEVTVNKHSNIE